MDVRKGSGLQQKRYKRAGLGDDQKTERRPQDGQMRLQFTASYKVNHSDELLEFLLRKCNTSRNNVKSLLTRGQVYVNGSVVTQYNFMLAKDDEVKISKTGTKVDRTAQKNPSAGKTYRLPFPILFENDEFIAVEKPAGLLSVESDKERECAYAHVCKYLQSKQKTLRPFVLHRIDKETSGVLIFAKDVKIHSMLKLRWNDLVTAREYYAVVEGELEKKEDTVVAFLKENANNLVYVSKDGSGQRAVTHYEVVKEKNGLSLLRVNIETGRKNQIRVQMQALGHPVVCDEKYGFTKDPMGRLGLHASKLEFTHPISGELISVSSALPASFKKLFGGEK